MTESLRGNLDSSASKATVLSLDRLVFQVLVGSGFNDEGCTQYAALDELIGSRSRHDRVVVRTGHTLIAPLDDDNASWNHIQYLAHRMSDGRHLGATLRAHAHRGWHLRDPLICQMKFDV